MKNPPTFPWRPATAGTWARTPRSIGPSLVYPACLPSEAMRPGWKPRTELARLRRLGPRLLVWYWRSLHSVALGSGCRFAGRALRADDSLKGISMVFDNQASLSATLWLKGPDSPLVTNPAQHTARFPFLVVIPRSRSECGGLAERISKRYHRLKPEDGKQGR